MSDPNHNPRIYIVILNWNGWADTVECLESVLRQDYPNYQIVVCDNDSANQSVEQIQSWAGGQVPVEVDPDHPLARLTQPPVPKPVEWVELSPEDVTQGVVVARETPLVLIRTGGNLGFAGGNNVGLRHALNDPDMAFCWLLNNDTVIESDCLQEMLAHSLAKQADGVPNTCGSVQCFYDDPNVIQALGGFRLNRWTGICSMTLGRFLKRTDDIDHDAFRKQMHTVHGCSWLLSRAFLEQIGLMDDRYFLYYEELDWTLRSEGQFALTYADKAVVYHKEGSSIGSKSLNQSSSLLSEFYTARNKYWLALKFFPAYLPTIFLGTLLQALNRARRGEWDKARLLLKVALGKQQFP